jgi:hypothetical protein
VVITAVAGGCPAPGACGVTVAVRRLLVTAIVALVEALPTTSISSARVGAIWSVPE